ncbi:MAG: GTP-binding protein [Eggerthellaceae bacterium]|nr:GTP-binding protein [Eggerthellaceae bacterium]
MGKPDVLILSGFLGSGKTTVLVKLAEHLRAKRGPGYRIAIIENEIGSASVDSSVISEAGYSVTEMLSGCVCCTLVGQLVPAIQKLSEELEPDLVVLEATGVATPQTMRDSIEKYGGCPVRIATIVDASRWHKILLALRILLEGQVEPADVVCVNKCDRADEEQLTEVESTVREMNAHAPIVYMSAAGPVSADDLDRILEG